jgi:ABC-type nitrate/sulfonate/bicarbonate transport system substrate-binding protein
MPAMPIDLSRRVMLGQGACALAAAGARPALAAAIPIRIANAAGGVNLIMGALMRQERFLESFGLDPDLMNVADGSRILGGLVGGSLDASLMSGFGQVFPAIERGAPIRIIGAGSMLPLLAMFTSKPNISTLKDLEGKTVGTGSIGALVYQLTVTLLRKYKVDISKVRFVNIGSSADVFRAVAAGTVDAGAGEAAQVSEASKRGVRLIEHGNMSVELPAYTYQGAWTSVRKIATQRDALVRALAAYGRLYRFVQTPEAKPSYMRAHATAFPSSTPEEREAQWTYIQTFRPFAVNLAIGPDRINYMQSLNISFNVQKRALPYAQVADMSLAAEALKLLGGPHKV